ncbi:hypothetical protein ABE438_17415 [Bosea sp. TWI1241]|uniref:hypothetical protein n=1 Tax=Bosea sp. TWI1241 TaxID=3148904 RepID=UPI00320A2D42
MPSLFAARHRAVQPILDERHGEPFAILPRAGREPDPARFARETPFVAIFHEAQAASRHAMNGKVPGLSVPGLAASTRQVAISIDKALIPAEWRSAAAPLGLRRGDLFIREDGTAWVIEDVLPAGPARIDCRVLEAKAPV